jgi:SAM-dependent methyltransferase
MRVKQQIKTLMNTFPSVKIAAFVADDFLHGLRLISGPIGTDSGSTHATLSATESLSYIEEVFTDYKKYGGLEKFFGRVAEIGPGDSAGVALLMRGDGCTQIDLVDRYLSHRNPEQQSRIYEALAQKYKLDSLKTKDFWDERALAGITWRIGQASEIYFSKCAQEQGEIYDFIVSRAVLEHLYDPLSALQDMVACVKPGGRMFHKIDFRDHNMFSQTHHELTFLEVPSSIYPLMVRNSGRPNRILLHRYRTILESMKNSGLIDYSILVTRLVSVGEITPHEIFENIPIDKRQQAINFVEEHRKKFAMEFRDIDNQDLAISGIFLTVTKN